MLEVVISVTLYTAKIFIGFAHSIIVVKRDKPPFSITIRISCDCIPSISPYAIVIVWPVIRSQIDTSCIVFNHAINIHEITDRLIIVFIGQVCCCVFFEKLIEVIQFCLAAFFQCTIFNHGNVFFWNIIIGFDEVIG